MKFNFKLALQIIYFQPYFLRVVLYWNYVPFIIFITNSVGSTLFSSNSTMLLLLNGLAILLTILFQFYQWSFSFFTMMDASEGKLGVPEYNLMDLFSDWGVKLKLLLIRVVYYLPGLLVFAIQLASLANADIVREGGLEVPVSAILTSGVVLLWIQFVENFILPGALYEYSYSNSLSSAFNLVKISRFTFHNVVSLIGIAVVNFVGYLVIGGALLAVTPFLLIPIIGAVILSIVFGLLISWQVLFIPTLIGQVWQSYHATEVNTQRTDQS